MPKGGVPLEGFEKQLIKQSLDVTGCNQSSTARLLRLGRGALQYQIKKCGFLKWYRAFFYMISCNHDMCVMDSKDKEDVQPIRAAKPRDESDDTDCLQRGTEQTEGH